MGLKISQLLKWKTPVILLHDEKPILDDDGKPVTVWLRVIGDDDLQEAHTLARLSSAKIRQALGDESNPMYKDRIEPIMGASREDCIEVLTQYRTSNLLAEARVKIEREELPTIDQVAVEPDAPTLEEQEKLDQEIREQEEKYNKDMEEYVQDRTEVIVAELERMDLDTLRTTTMEEISGIIALSEFFNRLIEHKVYRGSYIDKECTERAFDSIEDYLITDGDIKQQLTDAYLQLEYDPESIKK